MKIRRYLLAAGEDFAKKGRLEAAAVLIQYGADINLKNRQGMTPLQGMFFRRTTSSATEIFCWGSRFSSIIERI